MYFPALEKQILKSLCELISKECELKSQTDEIKSLLEEILYYRGLNTKANDRQYCNATTAILKLKNCSCGHLHIIKLILGLTSNNDINPALPEQKIPKHLEAFILYTQSLDSYVKNPRGEEWQKQVKKLSQETKNPFLLIHCYVSLALEKYDQKDYKSVKLYWDEIKNELDTYKEDIPINILLIRSWTYHHLKLYKQANNYFEDCLKKLPEDERFKIIITMADNCYHLRQYDEAIKLCEHDDIRTIPIEKFTKEIIPLTHSLSIKGLALYEKAKKAKKISERKKLMGEALKALNVAYTLANSYQLSYKAYAYCTHKLSAFNRKFFLFRVAMIYCDLEKCMHALKSLKPIKNIDELKPDIYWLYAIIYYWLYIIDMTKKADKTAAKFHEDATGYFNKAKQSIESPLYMEDGNISLICTIFGDIKGAVKYIDLALQKHRTAFNLLQKVKLLLDQKKHNEALQLINEAAAMDDTNKEIFFIRAFLLTFFGRWGEAVETIDKAIVLDPKNTNYQLVKANYLLHLQRYTKAKLLFKKLREKYPKNYEIHASLTVIYFEKKQYKKALNYCEEAIAINPESQMVKKLMHIIQYILGQYSNILGNSEKLNNRHQEKDIIIDDIQLVLLFNFSFVGILFLCREWQTLEQLLHSFKCFLLEILRPNVTYKPYDDLWKILPIIKGMQPMSAFYCLQTLSYLEQNKYECAYKCIESFFLHSKNSHIKELLQYYLPSNQKKCQKKINQLNTLTNIPQYDMLILSAELNFRLGKFNKAVDDYFTALHINPPSIQIYYKIAMCFKKMHEYSLAVHFLAKSNKILNNQSPTMLKELSECEKLSLSPTLETSILLNKCEKIKNKMAEFFVKFLRKIEAKWLTPLKQAFLISYNPRVFLPGQAKALLLQIQNWINANKVLRTILSVKYKQEGFSCTLKDPYSLYKFSLYKLNQELKTTQEKANAFILKKRLRINDQLIAPCRKILKVLDAHGCGFKFSVKDIKFKNDQWQINLGAFHEIIKKNAYARKISFDGCEYILGFSFMNKFWSYAHKMFGKDVLRIDCINDKNEAIDPILFLNELYEKLETQAKSSSKEHVDNDFDKIREQKHLTKRNELLEKIKACFCKISPDISFKIEPIHSKNELIFIARGNVTKFKKQIQKFTKKFEEYLLVTNQYCDYITKDYSVNKKRSKKNSKRVTGVVLHFDNTCFRVCKIMRGFYNYLPEKNQKLSPKKKPKVKKTPNKKNPSSTQPPKQSGKSPKQKKITSKKFSSQKNIFEQLNKKNEMILNLTPPPEQPTKPPILIKKVQFKNFANPKDEKLKLSNRKKLDPIQKPFKQLDKSTWNPFSTKILVINYQ
jgi:tetratricopeptide (TPR) repeat protein